MKMRHDHESIRSGLEKGVSLQKLGLLDQGTCDQAQRPPYMLSHGRRANECEQEDQTHRAKIAYV